MLKENDKVPFTSHLEELRSRIIVCFIAVGIGIVVCYSFKAKIFHILALPLIKALPPGDKLIFTGLPEAFLTYLSVSFIAGIMVSAPVLLYEFWMFIAPGLYQKERRIMLPIVVLSTFFFIGGVSFGYFVVCPFGFKFLMGFASDSIRPLPSMGQYLRFSTKLLMAFGVVFELPLVVVFLARLGIVSADFLKKYRKYAVLVAFIAGALLTPPEVLTQTLMAIPLLMLYELSILGARIFGKKKPVNKDKATESEAPRPAE